jgi:hypothetical protein
VKPSLFIASILFAMHLAIGVKAQEMVEYTLDFSFEDGIYLDFMAFKSNDPIPITHVISDKDIRSPNYMEQVTDEEYIRYFDGFGEQRTVATDKIWGYAFNGKAFIGYGDGFFRMPMLGTITHFTAAVTTYRMMSDPMMMSPGMMPYREVPVQELRQFILDMRTGKVLPYSEEHVLSLMTDADELVRDFEKLKRKQRQQQLILLIRRYNERFPLFFPE